MCHPDPEQQEPTNKDLIYLIVIVVMAVVIILETFIILRRKLQCCQRSSANQDLETTNTDWNHYYGDNADRYSEVSARVEDRNQYYSSASPVMYRH